MSKLSWYEDFYNKSDWNYPTIEKGIKELKGYLLLHNIFNKKEGFEYKNSKLLDIGTGSGYWSEVFSSLEMDVVGIDFSKVAIKKATEKWTHPQFMVGDGTALPFKENVYDIIFCNGCSLFSTTKLSGIKDLMDYYLRFLKKGGFIVFISASDLSGTPYPQNDWINHNLKDIRSFFDDCNGRVIGPIFVMSRLLELCKAIPTIPLKRIFIEFISTGLGLYGKIRRRRLSYVYIVVRND